jgi:prepilin-type N-terminal cleavage/methylation domain-containing protein
MQNIDRTMKQSPTPSVKTSAFFSSRRICFGFTLIELLVVIVVIGLLVALLMPAVQMARESARRTLCKNNLKQIANAVMSYQSATTMFPMSASIPKAGFSSPNKAWSIHVRLLPFMEQTNLYDVLDLNSDWDTGTNKDVLSNVKIASYICPSDEFGNKTREVNAGGPKLYPTTYGFNQGTWFIYGTNSGKTADGPFIPNSSYMPQHIEDGMSNTILAAEVKSWQAYSRNHGPAVTDVPADTATIVTECTDSAIEKKWDAVTMVDRTLSTGHTEWVDGRVHSTGFTTVFTPNKLVEYSIVGPNEKKLTVKLDYTSWQEGLQDTSSGNAVKDTFAAVTSRSDHPQMVNIALMDGSARSVSDSIDLRIWRALGTRKSTSGEVEPGAY